MTAGLDPLLVELAKVRTSQMNGHAERNTRIGDAHSAPAPEVDIEGVLEEKQIAAVALLTIVINTWNRIAIASHYPVAP